MSQHPDRVFRPISPAAVPEDAEENVVADSSTDEATPHNPHDDPSYQARRRVFSEDSGENVETPKSPECEEVEAINRIPDIGHLRLTSPEIRRPTAIRRPPPPEQAGSEVEIRSPVKLACVVRSISGEGSAFSGNLQADIENAQLVSMSVGDPPDFFRAIGGETCNGMCTGGRGPPCPGSCRISSVREVHSERYSQPLRLDEGSMVVSTSEVSSTISGAERNRPNTALFGGPANSPSISSTSGVGNVNPYDRRIQSVCSEQQRCSNCVAAGRQSHECCISNVAPNLSARSGASATENSPLAGSSPLAARNSPRTGTQTDACNQGLPDSTTPDRPLFNKENTKSKMLSPKPSTCGLQSVKYLFKGPPRSDDDDDEMGSRGKGKSPLQKSPR